MLTATPGRAGALDGVQLPDTVAVGGTTLHLNGVGLRTFSILGLHIYVAALYLEHPSTNAPAILASPESKLLRVSFVHSVSAAQARDSWREGLANNCLAPCALNTAEVETFLAHVPAMQAGDDFSLLFTSHGVTVNLSGRQLGVVSDTEFAKAMLATFLGPRPGAPDVKRQLLAGRAVTTPQ